MCGAESPPERGAWGQSPQFRKCLCLYIDSPHPKPLLPKGGYRVFFNNVYLEKYTLAAISEEEKKCPVLA